ncbi:MAG: aminoacetone oxidase family FAD-binding enzyme [Planctomycetes bacterium]|nr:aminoacetone oxidase family FAD-binding enzyme [Planctomycetota bacterium]
MDIAIVGGGAAGLATAIFAARLMPSRSVVVLDGADKLGAKILMSGGGRCNITNRVVTAADFRGGNPNAIKQVLAAFPVARTVKFFQEIGVELCEEDDGKLFPKTNRALTVLAAMLGEVARLGVRVLHGQRVTNVRRIASGHHISAGAVTLSAGNVVLATGGQSFPKTGSDGSGYKLAGELGHTLVPPTPALVPLVLDGGFHVPLSGISHDVELTVQAAGWKPVRVHGELLWTHFGISGPAVLDLSRHWHRACLERRAVTVFANLVPGEDAASVEGRLLTLASAQPRVQLHNALARLLPARVADSLLDALAVPGTTPMAHLPRDARRKVVQALVRWPLPVLDSRGYSHAETTAGGVPLAEVNPRGLDSRKCPGLYFVGEILDADGRIGGFNFQWAWASAWVAATALARAVKPDGLAAE